MARDCPDRYRRSGSSNYPAAGKTGIECLLASERHCPGLPEPGSRRREAVSLVFCRPWPRAAALRVKRPPKMRIAFVILVSVLCAGCQHQNARGRESQMKMIGTAAEDRPEPLDFPVKHVNGKASHVVSLGLSDCEGKIYFFETREVVLNGTPRWRTNADFPPLAPREAEAAGRREVQRLRPDVAEWTRLDIELHQIINDCWCYNVCFLRGDVSYTGSPPVIKVPVLMNGQAVCGALQQKDVEK